MIPADHITIDGDTALWVLPPTDKRHAGGEPDAYTVASFNRPCDTCGGRGRRFTGPSPGYRQASPEVTCHNCDGTGRHTFDIAVERQCPADTDGDGDCAACYRTPDVHGFDTFRVHVIDVLEIASGHDAEYRPMIWLSSEGVAWLMVEGEPSIITLPPDAVPGMWLVRLAVHTPENVEEPT